MERNNLNAYFESKGNNSEKPEAEKQDKIRTEKLESLGYKVIRFCNRDVDTNFYNVCSVIDLEVSKRTLPQSR